MATNIIENLMEKGYENSRFRGNVKGFLNCLLLMFPNMNERMKEEIERFQKQHNLK